MRTFKAFVGLSAAVTSLVHVKQTNSRSCPSYMSLENHIALLEEGKSHASSVSSCRQKRQQPH